jgi:two-component system, LytTR family, response regulator
MSLNPISSISVQSGYLTLPASSRNKQKLRINDILCLEAESNYTYFYTACGKKYIAARTMKDFFTDLAALGFVRVHKSFIVNLKHIKAYDFKKSMAITLVNGREVLVSRRKRKDFEYLATQFACA